MAMVMMSPAINWGLKMNEHEVTPVPPPGTVELLREYNGLFVGDTTKKEVYFTFDLGYEAGYTNDVLDVLKKNDIRAIFFLCGHYLTEEAHVRRMLDEGHVIGNHTDKHRDLPTLSVEAMRKDILDFDVMYKEKFVDAAPITYFRPPKGRISETVLRETHALGLKTVMWSGACVDWGKEPIDAQKNADKLTRRVHPGCVYLFHIANSGMAPMLELLISQIGEKGYKVGDATLL